MFKCSCVYACVPVCVGVGFMCRQLVLDCSSALVPPGYMGHIPSAKVNVDQLRGDDDALMQFHKSHLLLPSPPPQLRPGCPHLS